MKRASDILACGIAVAALLGGVGYGWQRLTSPPPMPPVPPLNEAAARLPPIPEAAPPPPAPTPPQWLPQARPQPDPAALAQAAEDRQVFQDLRRNCYEAAAYNSRGEYPGFQAAACDRYAQFADEHGWNTGALPGYARPAPPPQVAVEQQPYSSWDQNGYPPQVVYLGPVYGGGVPHRPPREPQNNQPPQGQIGPNYTPPPMQQAPPVSQHHSPTAPSRPAAPGRTH